MSTDLILRAAYGANIAMLVPVVLSRAPSASPADVSGATVPESAGLRSPQTDAHPLADTDAG